MEKRKPVGFSYKAVRDEFNQIRDDYAATSAWLRAKKQSGYSTKLLAYITGLAFGTITERLTVNRGRRRKREGIIYAPVAHVPDDWKEKGEWLARMVQTHSAKEIAMIVGEKRGVVYNVLNKYGLKLVKRRVVHPYNNKEWLQEHSHLTAQQISKLAKVTKKTVISWRTQHGMSSVPAWAEAIRMAVREFVTIKSGAYDHDNKCYRLTFGDGSSEYVGELPKDEILDLKVRYRYSQIDPHNVEIRYQPLITTQYEDHFELQYNPIAVIGVPNTANPIEKMVARHMFLQAYYNRCSFDGFINHPKHIIDTSLARLRTLYNNVTFRQKFGRIQSNGFENQCYRILEYYIDLFALDGSHCSPDMATAACMAVPIDRLNTTRFIRRLATYLTRVTNPILLAQVWAGLGIAGRVLDLWPHNGTKALTCWLLGLEYCTLPNYVMDMAKDRGFFDYIGLKYSTYDGTKVDLAIAEKTGLSDYEDKHFRFLEHAEHTMLVCTDAELNRIRDKYAVKRVIPITSTKQPLIEPHNSNIVIL